MKLYWLLAISLTFGIHASAQVVVHGMVFNSKGGRPLRDVTVRVVGFTAAAGATDSQGRFTLQIAPPVVYRQKITIIAQKTGFESYTKSDVTVADPLDFDIFLVPLGPLVPKADKPSTLALPILNPDLSFLVARLSDSVLTERLNAISKLGSMGPPAQPAATYLADTILADKQGDLCVQAAEAIVQIGFSQATLIDKLFDASIGTAPIQCRVAAVRALGASGQLGRRYLSNLKVSFKYETPLLQNAEAEAILRLSPAPEDDALKHIEQNFSNMPDSASLHQEAAKSLEVVSAPSADFCSWATSQPEPPDSSEGWHEHDKTVLKIIVRCGPSTRRAFLVALGSYTLSAQYQVIAEWLKLDPLAVGDIAPFFSAEWKNAKIKPADLEKTVAAARWIISQNPEAAYDCSGVVFDAMETLQNSPDVFKYGLQFISSQDNSTVERLIDATPISGRPSRFFWLTLIAAERIGSGVPAVSLKEKTMSMLHKAAESDPKTIDFDLQMIVILSGRSVEPSTVPLLKKALESQPLVQTLGDLLQTAKLDVSVLPIVEGKLRLNIGQSGTALLLTSELSRYEQVTYLRMLGSFAPLTDSDVMILAAYLATDDDVVASAAEEALTRVGPTAYPTVLRSFDDAGKSPNVNFFNHLQELLARMPPQYPIILDSLRERPREHRTPAAYYSVKTLLCADRPPVDEAAQALVGLAKDGFYRKKDLLLAFASLGSAGAPGLNWIQQLNTKHADFDSDDLKGAVYLILHDKKATCLMNSKFEDIQIELIRGYGH